jgi:N-acyl-D-amino-acid deacylase
MSAPDRDIDILIRGARVVDGTGNPWYHGDIAVRGDRIVDVAPPGLFPAGRAREEVDAAGMVVCPGFIDIQSHSILPLMRDGRCLSKITQGVTTEIMGESWTPAPFGGRIDDPFGEAPIRLDLGDWRARARGWRRFRDWLDAMIDHGVSPNIGSFLGGGTLRQYVKGMAMGRCDAGELATLRRVVAEAMDDGAFGVSYALIYPPDHYAGTDEIVEALTVAGRYGGLYITHMRSEADGLEQGVEEALDIGRRAGTPVEIYHLKASGRRNWPKMPGVIARIDAARAAGQDVTADMYPYVAGGTALTAVLPPWAAADGKLFDNLRDPTMRARIRAEALTPGDGWEPMGTLAGPEGVVPLDLRRPEHAVYVNRPLSEIAAARGQEWIDAVCDLLLAEGHGIGTMYFMIDEENVRLELRQPWMKIATDAGGLDPAWATALGPTHPRSYGTYPRVLGQAKNRSRWLQNARARLPFLSHRYVDLFA